jgi:TRAP-type mannitol/chloroaromatic compound transport system permease small subunit
MKIGKTLAVVVVVAVAVAAIEICVKKIGQNMFKNPQLFTV